MNERDLKLLEEFKNLMREDIMTGEGINYSPTAQIWLYGNVYLKLHNLLASHGIGKHDDGQLS